MTVTYGQDNVNFGTSAYGQGDQQQQGAGFDTVSSNPALQRHLQGLQTHMASTTTPYAAQPFNPNPPSPTQMQGQANAQLTQAPSPDAATAANPSSTANQIPNQTSLAGSSAGGSADTANVGANNQPTKPGAAPQMPGGPVGPPSPIDMSSTDSIGKLADSNQAGIIAQMRARVGAGGVPGSLGSPNMSGVQLSSNQNVPGFDGEQVGNARQIIQAGLARGASRQDIEAAVTAALTESSLRNLGGGDRDSAGLYQMRPSQGWGTYEQVTDPNYEIAKFYDMENGIGDRANMTPWALDQAIERSGFADGSNYQGQYGEAKRLVDALTMEQPQGKAANPTMQPNGSLQWISQNTDKYLDFDGYYGAQCVDLYDFYCTGYVGASPIPVGYADEIWNNHDTNAFTQIDRGQLPQMGDVAVWGQGPYTPMSHVGIILGDNGDGTVKTLSNNATSDGPSGNSAIVNISKDALLGYLRPNRNMGA